MKPFEKVLLVASPVGLLLQSGAVGGVRNAIYTAYQALTAKGFQVNVLALIGSAYKSLSIIHIPVL